MSNIAFKATVQEDILIDADELEVSLAIYNILKNAVEAVKSVDDAFVSLEISRDGDDCCLIVKDNGAPLTEEQKSTWKVLSVRARQTDWDWDWQLLSESWNPMQENSL